MSALSNKKIFVTGGLGFIGSNFVKKLLDNGATVKIYDNYSSGSTDKLRRLGVRIKSNRLEIIRGDILDKAKLTRAMKGADGVAHMAAQLEITKAVSDPYYDLTSNTVGTINVLEGMLKNNCSVLVNSSSACVYGQKNNREIPTPEEVSLEPNWAYGVSKLAAEKYCAIYGDLHGITTISARYAIVYGPNEWYGRAMPVFIKNTLQKKPLIIFGSGDQTRDFIHVDDVVDFTCLSLQSLFKNTKKKGSHTSYNVSTAKKTTILQLAKKIIINAKKLYGHKIELIYDVVKEGETSAYFDRMRLPSELKNMVLDNTKAKKILDFRPRINLDDGLHEQMKWAQSNSDMWNKMSY